MVGAVGGKVADVAANMGRHHLLKLQAHIIAPFQESIRRTLIGFERVQVFDAGDEVLSVGVVGGFAGINDDGRGVGWCIRRGERRSGDVDDFVGHDWSASVPVGLIRSYYESSIEAQLIFPP